LFYKPEKTQPKNEPSPGVPLRYHLENSSTSWSP